MRQRRAEGALAQTRTGCEHFNRSGCANIQNGATLQSGAASRSARLLQRRRAKEKRSDRLGSLLCLYDSGGRDSNHDRCAWSIPLGVEVPSSSAPREGCEGLCAHQRAREHGPTLTARAPSPSRPRSFVFVPPAPELLGRWRVRHPRERRVELGLHLLGREVPPLAAVLCGLPTWARLLGRGHAQCCV